MHGISFAMLYAMEYSRKQVLLDNVSLLKSIALRDIAIKIANAKVRGAVRIAWACRLTELSSLEVYRLGLQEVIREFQELGYKVSIETSRFDRKTVNYLNVSWR